MKRAERLEHAGLRRHRDRHAGELLEAAHQWADQSPVADQQHGAVDLDAIVERVDVAGDALEEAAEEATVVLALVGVVGQLALREHRAATGDDEGVGAGLGQPHGLVEVATETVAEPFDRLARARRAALVGLEGDDAAGVAGEHRVAAAADADDVERAVAEQPRGGALLRDLVGEACPDRRAETVAEGARRGDAGHPAGPDLAVQLEERAQRIAEVADAARRGLAETAVVAQLRPGERRGHLAEVDADEHGAGGRALDHASSIRHPRQDARSTAFGRPLSGGDVALRGEGLDLGEQRAPLVLVEQRRFEGVARELHEVAAAQPKRLLGGDQVVDEVAAEVGRVVGVHGHDQPGVEEPLERVLLEAPHDAQLHVREGTHGERDALAPQALHQRRILGDTHAVVDASHLKHVERLADVRRRALFAGVGDRDEALGPRPREHAGERARRVPALGRVEPDAGQPVAVRAAPR